MGFFDLFRTPDINQGFKEFCNTEGAVLLDVRSEQEYAQGHLPGSTNVPLPSITRAEAIIADRDTPIFVHCLSGGRSSRAATMLSRMGYHNVKNIGGISAYTGEVVY